MKQMVIIMMMMMMIIIITVMQRGHLQDVMALAKSLRDVIFAGGLKKV